MAKRKLDDFQQSTQADVLSYHTSKNFCGSQAIHTSSRESLESKVLRSGTQIPDVSKFNDLLANIAKQMSSEDLEKMRSKVKGKRGLGRHILESIGNGQALFNLSKKYRLTDTDNLHMLQALVHKLQNPELFELGKTYAQTESNVKPFKFPPKQPRQPTRLNIICEAKFKESIPHGALSKYMRTDGGEFSRDFAHLSWFCSMIKAFSRNVIRVWIGYRADSQKIPLFIAVVKKRDPHLDKRLGAVLQTEFPFSIIQRQLDEVSDEAMRCLKSENRLSYSLKEHHELRETIIRHSNALMQSHSNLLIVSASPIKSRKAGEDIEEMTCIVLYVHIKGIIPLQEKPFPLKVGEFPVDVREGVFKKYNQTKLSLGNEIRSYYGLTGRLGGFVRLSDGKLGCFTCGHLFDTDQSRTDFARDAFNPVVYQVVPNSSHRLFGKVVDLRHIQGNQDIIGVDAALIEITDRLKTPEDASFRIHPDSESDTLTEFSSGEVLTSAQEVVEVLHSGHAKCKIVRYNERKNQMYKRSGRLKTEGATVVAWRPQTSDERCNLYAQFEIQPDFEEIPASDDQSFAKEGESGSLVFIESDDLKNKWAIGMVVGGINANGSCIATPIWAILDSFNLPRRLLSFENQRLNQIELLMRDVHAGITGLQQRLEQGFSDIQARFPPP